MTTRKSSGTTTKRCSSTKTDGEFRRSDDVERLAKLEYVVFEDHEQTLLAHEQEIKIIRSTQLEIKDYLKNIKNILIAFLIGAAASQFGWTNLLKILASFVAP